jgi:gallate dioxygenase
VPLQVGVLQLPIPSARRCFKLPLLRRPSKFLEDIKVVVVGTGGLSHQIQGERAGFNNTPWDMEFLDLLENNQNSLTSPSPSTPKGRNGRLRVIMWLVMRGALAPKVKSSTRLTTRPQ